MNRRHRTDLAALAQSLERELAACRLCPHRCGVDRRARTGICGLGVEPLVYKDLLHVGEERPIIPSYAVFVTGCSLRCTYCSEASVVVDPSIGRPLSGHPTPERIEAMKRAGARTIQFVGGEPAVNLPGIAAFVARRADALDDLPLVVTTNLWVEPIALDAVAALADRVVVDLKVGNGACAARLSGVASYVGVVLANLAALHARGTAILVRHLVVPGHLECCTRPVLTALERWPDVPVNVLTGYVPFGGAAASPGPEAHPPRLRERRELAAKVRAWRSGRLWIDGEGPG